MKVQTFLDCMGEIDERFLDVEPSPQEDAAENAAAPREMIPSAVPPAEPEPGRRFFVILRRVLPFAVTVAACIGGIVMLASLRPRDDYTFYQGSGYEAEVTQDQPRDGTAASDTTGTTVTTATEPEVLSGAVTADTDVTTKPQSKTEETQSAQTTTKPQTDTQPAATVSTRGTRNDHITQTDTHITTLLTHNDFVRETEKTEPENQIPDTREFYVAVGTFNGKYTQLRYFSPKNASGLNAEKAVWKDAPAGIQYGDIFVADGTVSLSKVQTAPDDPANEMLYHYEIGSGSRLKKAGTCAELMQPKNLTVTNCDYDGSSHWSILYEDPETGQTYYYGLATYGSALGIDPHDCETGDVYTFAMFGDNLIVPLAKKSAASPHKVMQMTTVAEVEREGDRAAGAYLRRIAELKGEIRTSAPRITVEAVKTLINSGMTYSEIERKLEEQYRYPDFYGGSGMTRYEYWLDNTGRNVILLGHESEQITYLIKSSPECELWELLLG